MRKIKENYNSKNLQVPAAVPARAAAFKAKKYYFN